LKIIIDGKKYELRGNGWFLTPSGYKARLTRDEHKTVYKPSQTRSSYSPTRKPEGIFSSA